MKPLQLARPPWSSVVLVCEKCARKAGQKGFAKRLKGALNRNGLKRTIRVVSSGCLDLCPKRRITIATTDDLTARRLTVLAPSVALDDVVAMVARGLPSGRDGDHGVD